MFKYVKDLGSFGFQGKQSGDPLSLLQIWEHPELVLRSVVVAYYDTPKSRRLETSYLWGKQTVPNEADKKNTKFWVSRVWLLNMSKLNEMALPVAKNRSRLN